MAYMDKELDGSQPQETEFSLTPATEERMLPSTEFRESVPDMEEEISIKDYLDVLLRRKWLVLGFLLLTFISTAVFTLSATRIYKTTATIEVSREQAKVTNFEEMMGSELRSQEFMQTQVGLLESKTLAKRVAEKLDMKQRLEALQEGQ